MNPALLLLCYLIGSISFPGIYAKMKGIDLRKRAGHLGASSIYFATGSKLGTVICGVLDVLKGSVCYLLAGTAGSAAGMMGHIFPVFFNFEGGNAVSMYYGTLLAANPKLVSVGLVELVIFLLLRKRSRALRQVLYLCVRALPALLFPPVLPLYGILLFRHIYFFFLK